MSTAVEAKQTLTIQKNKETGVAEVHLHINKTNAYTLDFYKELNAAIDDIRFDPDMKVAVLMSDMPKFFSVGADINFLKAADPVLKHNSAYSVTKLLIKLPVHRKSGLHASKVTQ